MVSHESVHHDVVLSICKTEDGAYVMQNQTIVGSKINKLDTWKVFCKDESRNIHFVITTEAKRNDTCITREEKGMLLGERVRESEREGERERGTKDTC